MSEHDKFRELIEPYALGSLDAGERSELEAHLRAGCSDCAKALDEARWLVAQLAYLAPEAVPSEILKGRLLQQVRADARSEPHSSRIPLWIWGAVAASLLFALYTAWDARQTQVAIRKANESAAAALEQQKHLRGELALARREAMILTDPKSVKILLPPSASNMPVLEAMWHEKMGLCITGRNIPMPPPNRALQLWLIPKSAEAKPMPSVMRRPEPDGTFMMMVSNPPEDMHNVKALAITEEPAGGSPQPTSSPLWVGTVS